MAGELYAHASNVGRIKHGFALTKWLGEMKKDNSCSSNYFRVTSINSHQNIHDYILQMWITQEPFAHST